MSAAGKASPIRVCLWAPLPPPDGGISRWTTRFCREAGTYGLDVEVVDISPGTNAFTERSRFSFSRSRVAVRALGQLRTILSRRHTHVCHVTTSLFWGTPRDFLALLLCRRYGVPAVLNIRASSQIIEWREGLGGLRRFLLDRVLRSASAIAVLSEELKSYLEQKLPGLRVVLIPNMVAHEEFAPSGIGRIATRLPARRGLHRVLFVGFQTPMKGLGDLAQAILGIADCELVSVGDRGGAIDLVEQARMQGALQELREAGRIVETGPLAPEDVTALYSEVDVFALPSYREGLPNVLLEAMAAGLPCVATPVGAIPDVLEGGCGVLVPVGNSELLRAAIVGLLASPEQRRALGQRARDRISDRYSVARIIGQYRDLYCGLLDS
ncbi:MAG: glycosyltransferase family 4 protein [Chromatiales bacterium]|nr:glycosyltransferase family 4 protein [Chromatiales bacterium]